jgi:hypothetical protein
MDAFLPENIVCFDMNTVGDLYTAFFMNEYNLSVDATPTEMLPYLYDLAREKCQCTDKESLCNICTLVNNTKELSIMLDKFQETSAVMYRPYPLEELTDGRRARAELDFKNMHKMCLEKMEELIANFGELIYLNFKDSHYKIVDWQHARLQNKC